MIVIMYNVMNTNIPWYQILFYLDPQLAQPQGVHSVYNNCTIIQTQYNVSAPVNTIATSHPTNPVPSSANGSVAAPGLAEPLEGKALPDPGISSRYTVSQQAFDSYDAQSNVLSPRVTSDQESPTTDRLTNTCELEEMRPKLNRLRQEADLLMQERNDEIDRLTQEKSEEIARFRQDKLEEIHRLIQEKEKEITRLRHEKHEEIERLRKEKDKEITRVRQDKREEIDRLLQEKYKEIDRIRQEKNEEIEQLRKEKDQEITQVRQEQRQEITQLMQEKCKDIARVRQDRHEEIGRLRQEKDREIDRFRELVAQKEEEIKQLRQEKDEQIDQLHQLVAQKDKELQIYRQEIVRRSHTVAELEKNEPREKEKKEYYELCLKMAKKQSARVEQEKLKVVNQCDKAMEEHLLLNRQLDQIHKIENESEAEELVMKVLNVAFQKVGLYSSGSP